MAGMSDALRDAAFVAFEAKWLGFYEIMLCAAIFPGSSIVKSCIFTAFRNLKALFVYCVPLP